ncbi:MAG TPA: hypothetical protein EYG73_13440 [Arcobacter sp.]|nr:hypothetical protein [Arcobacter sp.]
MKLSNILKFIILISISSGLYAQDFYSYKLFDNKFQVIFPGEPSVQHIPKELLDPKAIEKSIPYEYKKKLTQKQIEKLISDIINRNNIQAYIYGDKVNQIAFTSQSMPSALKYDVGEYKQSTQKMLDKSIKDTLKTDGRTIINFSSIFNRKENTYIAIYTSSFFTEGQKRYASTKQIIYKKKVYKWTVVYSSLSDKYVFDNYQIHCKVIK